MGTPPDELIPALQQLLHAAADGHPRDWLYFATDRDTEFQPGVRWMLANPDSPAAGSPVHGRSAAIEWASPGGWTKNVRSQPMHNGAGERIGRIRLRTPRRKG